MIHHYVRMNNSTWWKTKWEISVSSPTVVES
jgi:hypothetical protein